MSRLKIATAATLMGRVSRRLFSIAWTITGCVRFTARRYNRKEGNEHLVNFSTCAVRESKSFKWYLQQPIVSHQACFRTNLTVGKEEIWIMRKKLFFSVFFLLMWAAGSSGYAKQTEMKDVPNCNGSIKIQKKSRKRGNTFCRWFWVQNGLNHVPDLFLLI